MLILIDNRSQYQSTEPHHQSTSSSSSSAVNPLDANKTIQTTSTNSTTNGQQASGSDEPHTKMAKLQPGAGGGTTQPAAKKIDKKKALKRL